MCFKALSFAFKTSGYVKLWRSCALYSKIFSIIFTLFEALYVALISCMECFMYIFPKTFSCSFILWVSFYWEVIPAKCLLLFVRFLLCLHCFSGSIIIVSLGGIFGGSTSLFPDLREFVWMLKVSLRSNSDCGKISKFYCFHPETVISLGLLQIQTCDQLLCKVVFAFSVLSCCLILVVKWLLEMQIFALHVYYTLILHSFWSFFKSENYAVYMLCSAHFYCLQLSRHDSPCVRE